MYRRFVKKLFFTSLLLEFPFVLIASDGVSLKADELFAVPFLDLPITNSMVASWVISILLVIAIRMAVGAKPKLIPTRSQAVIEIIVESIEGTIEPIVGRHMVRHTFPLLVGFFIFILVQNWSGLIPGVGTFGYFDADGYFLYYFRPGNADLNMTLAMAIVSFIAWIYYVMRYTGIKVLSHELFGNKVNKAEVPSVLYYAFFLIFFGVGLIEVISIAFRLVSLSFRLFGNVFGGENLIHSITGICSYILPVPFYFLEVLIGLIQAFVFTLLVAIYIGLVCNHGEEEPINH